MSRVDHRPGVGHATDVGDASRPQRVSVATYDLLPSAARQRRCCAILIFASSMHLVKVRWLPRNVEWLSWISWVPLNVMFWTIFSFTSLASSQVVKCLRR